MRNPSAATGARSNLTSVSSQTGVTRCAEVQRNVCKLAQIETSKIYYNFKIEHSKIYNNFEKLR
jgi:hypothetical protein